MEQKAIFPIFYLPPISYFKKLKAHIDHVCFEFHEHFPKQTYRNRACIDAPNGQLVLSIPLQKGANNRTKFKDVKISNQDHWQRIHWMSLQSSYRNSAYFEYYEADFELFYTQKYENLCDYNLGLLKLLFKLLKWELPLQFTNAYEKEVPIDFRDTIHPKKEIITTITPYYQVFEDRNGFLADLSIVDLLFNKGPQSNLYLS